jgi:hypothetical protein
MELNHAKHFFSRFLILINISSYPQIRTTTWGPLHINRPTVFHRPWNRREVQVDLLKFPSGQTLGVPVVTWKVKGGKK